VYGYKALRRGMKNGSGIFAEGGRLKKRSITAKLPLQKSKSAQNRPKRLQFVGLPFGKIPTFVVDVWLQSTEARHKKRKWNFWRRRPPQKTI
jgi:hypothetical protein